MGGQLSTVKKNEIINWKIEDKTSLFGTNNITELKLTGDIVLRDPTTDEISLKPKEIQKKNKDFLKKSQVIGILSPSKGNLQIIKLFYDENDNTIIELKKNNEIFHLNSSRASSWFNDTNALLRYLSSVTTGESHLIASELCQHHDCFNNDAKNRNNNKSHGRQHQNASDTLVNAGVSLLASELIGGRVPEYNYIINPNTGKKVSVFGKTGKLVLNNYIYQTTGKY